MTSLSAEHSESMGGVFLALAAESALLGGRPEFVIRCLPRGHGVVACWSLPSYRRYSVPAGSITATGVATDGAAIGG